MIIIVPYSAKLLHKRVLTACMQYVRSRSQPFAAIRMPEY